MKNILINELNDSGQTFLDVCFDYSNLPYFKIKFAGGDVSWSLIDVLRQGIVYGVGNWGQEIFNKGFCKAVLEREKDKIEGCFDFLGFFHAGDWEMNKSLFDFYKGKIKFKDVDPEVFVGESGERLEDVAKILVAEAIIESSKEKDEDIKQTLERLEVKIAIKQAYKAIKNTATLKRVQYEHFNINK